MPPRKDLTKPSLNDEVEQVLLLKGYQKTFLAEHIRGLISIYGLRGVKSDGAFGLMYDILFIDNITTDHFSQFQWMWGHHDSKEPQYDLWWSVFRKFLRDCFNKSREQLNRYFRESHPDAPHGTKWFPPPAKMAPPKADFGLTPPVAISTVNIKKRSPEPVVAASSPKSAGKRPAKRARKEKNPLETPGDSETGLEWPEESGKDTDTSSEVEESDTGTTDGADQETRVLARQPSEPPPPTPDTEEITPNPPKPVQGPATISAASGPDATKTPLSLEVREPTPPLTVTPRTTRTLSPPPSGNSLGITGAKSRRRSRKLT